MISIGMKSIAKLSLVLLFTLFIIFVSFQAILSKAGFAPRLIVQDPVVRGDLWSRKVTVYSNDSQPLYNVPVLIGIEESLSNVELYRYLTGSLMRKVTDDAAYGFHLIDSDRNGKDDTAAWIVPELSEAVFSVEGIYTEPEMLETIIPPTFGSQSEIQEVQQMEATGEISFVQSPYDCSASNVNCTLTTVTVDNGNGSVTMINYQKPVNFWNSTLNNWQAINMTFKQDSNPATTPYDCPRFYDYCLEGNFNVSFKDDPTTTATVLYEKDGTWFTSQPMAMYFRNFADAIDDKFKAGSPPKYVQSITGYTSDNILNYSGIFMSDDSSVPNGEGHYDIVYGYEPEGMKEELIINSFDDLPKPTCLPEKKGIDCTNLTLDMDFYLDYDKPRVDIYVDGEKVTGTGQDFLTQSRVEFRNKNTNKTLWYLPKPYAYDSNETEVSRIELIYEVKDSNDYIVLKTPYSWLNDSSRVYPVHIEPSTGIEYNATVDVYDIWNNIGHYYVNATSGIQITNHFQEYWTKNLVCVIFYWGSSSHEYCTDGGDWVWYNSTDGSTFSNLTGTTTAKWSGHQWDIALEYYLEANWTEIRITPTFENKKNKNYDKAELKWHVDDIRVKNTQENDTFEMHNGTWNTFWLNDTGLDIGFDNVTNRTYYLNEYPDNHTDYGVRVRWNESFWKNSVAYDMNYTLNATYGSGYNAPVDLIMDLGSASKDDVLSTSLWWVDAPAKIYDTSITVDEDPVGVGLQTYFTGTYYVENAAWTGTLILETDGNAQILGACDSNFVKLISASFGGGMGTYCAWDGTNYDVDCGGGLDPLPIGSGYTIDWTVEGCTAGTDNYRTEATDGQKTFNDEVSLTVSDTTPPAFTGNATNTTGMGTPANFTIDVTDNNALDNTAGYIFSTNNTGGWANSTYRAFAGSSTTLTAWNVTTLNDTAGTVVQWKFYANDTSDNWNVSASYNLTTTDMTLPIYLNNVTSAPNGTTYAPNTNYGFEINWTDSGGNFANSTFWTDLNVSGGVNFTTHNDSASGPDAWYINFTDVPAGTYYYRWYGNDTAGNENATDNITYVIAKGASSISLFINKTEGDINIVNNTGVNITVVNNVTGTTVNMTTDRADWSASSSATPYENTTEVMYSANYGDKINVTGWRKGNENYTSDSQTYYITIADDEPPKYWDNSTNNTNAGEPTLFSLNWTDNLGLSGYIFSTNNTGTWINDTWINFTFSVNGTYGWLYRRQHDITGSDGEPGNFTDYQVNITVINGTGTNSGNTFYTDNKTQADFEDIRFTYYNYTDGTETVIDYWNETTYEGDNATFWVEVPFITNSTNTNNTIYIYYGNDDASSTSNGANTFVFYDDFESYSLGDLDGQGGWSMSGNNPTLTDVVNTPVYEGGKAAEMYGTDTFADHAITPALTKGVMTFYARNEKNNDGRYYFLLFNDTGQQPRLLFDQDGYIDAEGTQLQTYSAVTWYKFEGAFDFDNDEWTEVWIDGVSRGTNITFSNNSFSETGYFRWTGGGTGTTEKGWLDLIYFRKYASPEPSHGAWGSEEIPTELWSNVTKTLNSTGGVLVQWCFYANDTSDNWNVTSCQNPFELTTAGGYLEVSLEAPPSTYTVVQNQTFTINATIFCRGGDCENVNGTAQYNGSSVNPDTPINMTVGDKPFYVQDTGSPNNVTRSCLTNPLAKDEYCNITFSINATNATGTFEIGVLFNSTDSEIADNHTNNSTVTIVGCTESIALWDNRTIFFGTLNPNTARSSNPAPGNANNLFNITNNGTGCSLEVWIKGTDLTNDTYQPPSTIDVSNITWTNISSAYDSTYPNLTTSYVSVNSSLPVSANVTTYYWINVPPVYTGAYNGTITFCGNSTSVC